MHVSYCAGKIEREQARSFILAARSEKWLIILAFFHIHGFRLCAPLMAHMLLLLQ
jgi:hypothetical protein